MVMHYLWTTLHGPDFLWYVLGVSYEARDIRPAARLTFESVCLPQAFQGVRASSYSHGGPQFQSCGCLRCAQTDLWYGAYMLVGSASYIQTSLCCLIPVCTFNP